MLQIFLERSIRAGPTQQVYFPHPLASFPFHFLPLFCLTLLSFFRTASSLKTLPTYIYNDPLFHSMRAGKSRLPLFNQSLRCTTFPLIYIISPTNPLASLLLLYFSPSTATHLPSRIVFYVTYIQHHITS